MMETHLLRMTLAEFEEELSWANENSDRASDEHSRRYWSWMGAKHAAVEKFERSGYVVFVKDLQCPDGDVVRMTAGVYQLFEGWTPSHGEDDEAAIRKMFSSAECQSR